MTLAVRSMTRRVDGRHTRVVDQLKQALNIDDGVIARAEVLSGRTGQRLEQVLNSMGVVADADLAEAYSAVCGIRIWDPSVEPAQAPDPELATTEFLRTRRLLILSASPDRLLVAAYDPLDDEGLAGLAFAAGRDIELRVARPSDYRRAAHEVLGAAIVEAGSTNLRLDAEAQRVVETDQDSEAARALTSYLEAALALRASDIHLEPRRHDFRVRLRVDGRLNELKSGSTELAAAAVSRLKVLANLNLGERRLPQDGRATFVIGGAAVETRVSIVPTVFGEAAVLRILDRVGVDFDFPSLGLSAAHVARLEEVALGAQGMFLISGPTGSGKTTTLYALLNRLVGSERKILSVEDPVEHHFAHVSQVQVQPAIGLTFDAALRSFLRQDPDVILVGEIRDPETAAVAVHAAMTGHLVLASIHASDAVRVVPRLLDLDLAPYQIASVIRGAASQRLARKLCPQCRQQRELGEPERVFFESAQLNPPEYAWSATGCNACGQTGYRGRLAVMEMLRVDEAFTHGVAHGLPALELDQIARRSGLIPMLQDGLTKAAAGLTSVQEIMAIIQS